tara:strand:- start:12588 stop:12911 length:324 start_codon:yes stop_codon:yes gene_type:complete
MTRRRYIQDRNTHELIEVTSDHRAPLGNDAGVLWGDRHYDGLKATDGSDISTRTKHREYMRANGVTMADDFSNTWAKSQEQRERAFQQGGSFSRRDVERAISQLQNR